MCAERGNRGPGAAGIADRGRMTPDPSALRAALERQAAVLAAVAARLRAVTAHPPISPYDWHGPAASAYRELEQHLRDGLRAADDAAEAARHSARLAIAQLGG
jgi:hypothetical protein